MTQFETLKLTGSIVFEAHVMLPQLKPAFVLCHRQQRKERDNLLALAVEATRQACYRG
jgi:hypothetical protein